MTVSRSLIGAEIANVPKDELVEVVAAVRAASHLIRLENKKIGRQARELQVRLLANRLQKQLLGSRGPDSEVHDDDDEWWATDPTELALTVRAAELEAEMIDAAMLDRVHTEGVKAQLEASRGRSARLRVYAERMRASGRNDCRFPSESEMTENLRQRLNAGVAS